jgi:putative membrane protein
VPAVTAASEGAALALPVLAAGAYFAGVARLWRHARRRGAAVEGWQVWCFGVGATAGVLAVSPPVEALAGGWLTWHMVQHLLLVLVAAPLVALGAPLLPMLWALPERWRPPLQGLRLPASVRRRFGMAARSAAATGVHVAALWVWHVPALYETALRSAWAHAAEHATMFGTALLLWAAVVSAGGPRRRAAPVAALAMFGTATLTVGLAALITFAPSPLYDHYVQAAGGPAALHDQQIAGALMWSVGGLVYAAVGASVLGVWLYRSEHPRHA